MRFSTKSLVIAALIASGAFVQIYAQQGGPQRPAAAAQAAATASKYEDYPSGSPEEMAKHCKDWDMTKMTYKDDTGTLNYTMGVYNKSESGKAAVLVFLHGIGERGEDGYVQNRLGVHSMVDYIRENKVKAVLITVQCPSNELWAPLHRGGNGAALQAKPMAACGRIPGLIEEKLKDASLNIDPDRVYITGLSMGGYGTWDTISRRPDLFAAAMPCCGGADPKQAPVLKNMAISIFHGSRDGLVPTNLSREMHKALEEAGCKNLKLTIYEGVEHNSWEKAYGDPENFKWLFAQKRTKEGAAAKPLPIDPNAAQQGGMGGFGGGMPPMGGGMGGFGGGMGGFGGGMPPFGGQGGAPGAGGPGAGGPGAGGAPQGMPDFGAMFGGQMPDFGAMFGGGMPPMGGGEGGAPQGMPDFGAMFGGNGGQMPDFGAMFGGNGGQMPDFGAMFGGGMPPMGGGEGGAPQGMPDFGAMFGGNGGMPPFGGMGGAPGAGGPGAGGAPGAGGPGAGGAPQGGFPFGGMGGQGGGMPNFGGMGGFGGGMGGFGGMFGGGQGGDQAGTGTPDKGSQIPKGFNDDGPTYTKVEIKKDEPIWKLWDADKKAWKDIEPLSFPAAGGAGGMGMMMGGFGGGGGLLKAGVKQIGDIKYVKDGSAAQTMDAYLPEIPAGKTVPAIIYIHGGAWMGGSARGCNAGFFDRLTKAGYAVFSINYRLSSEAKFPRATNDAKAAVRYVRAHAKEYGIDPDHIGTIGDSTGGNMAGVLGSTSNIKGLLIGDISDNVEVSSAVQAVVDLFGPQDAFKMNEHVKASGVGSPNHTGIMGGYLGGDCEAHKDQEWFIDASSYVPTLDPKTAPAFLIQHGTADAVVPDGASKDFHKALVDRIGKDKAIYESFEGAGHEDGRFFDEKNSARIIEFLDKYLKPAK